MADSAKEKLTNARCRVLVTEPWYGVIASRMVWVHNESVGTMGVSILPRGKVKCQYSLQFVQENTVDEIIAVICHEIEHVIRSHMSRARKIKTRELHELHNIAADWVINGYADNPRIKNLPKSGTFIPKVGKDDDKWLGCDLFELKENMTTEEFYQWLKDNTKVIKSGFQQKIDQDGGTITIDGTKIEIQTKGGSTIDVQLHGNHATWEESNASDEEMRQTAKDLTRSATQRAGKCPAHLQDVVKELAKPQENWFYRWRNILGRSAGGKRLTYSVRNRRNDRFGVKGYSRRASIKLVLGVDTSGSMSMDIIKKVFAEVDRMSQHFKITLVQFDTAVTDVSTYHKGDWRKIKIKGRGGTVFKSFFDYIETNGMVGAMNAVLTDGFDYDIPEEKPYRCCWIVVGKEGIDYLNKNCEWGEKVLIKHDIE